MDANETKIKRYSRGQNPNSQANLKPPIVIGEVRNSNGKPKGTLHTSTIVKASVPKEFDWIHINTRKIMRAEAIAEQAFEDLHVDGKLVLSHARDVMIRYEVVTLKGVKVVATSLNELIPESIKGDIENVATNNDAVKQLFEASRASDDALDKLGKYHGYLTDDAISKNQKDREQNYDIFLTAISLISRRSLADGAFADIVSKLYFHKFGKIPDVHVQQWFENKFDEIRARCDEVPNEIEVRQLTE
jgi:hypothetical protein